MAQKTYFSEQLKRTGASNVAQRSVGATNRKPVTMVQKPVAKKPVTAQKPIIAQKPITAQKPGVTSGSFGRTGRKANIPSTKKFGNPPVATTPGFRPKKYEK